MGEISTKLSKTGYGDVWHPLSTAGLLMLILMDSLFILGDCFKDCLVEYILESF